MLTAIAPGKVHLIGEHSVLYGQPAILLAAGLYARVRCRRAAGPYVRVVDARFEGAPAREWGFDPTRAAAATVRARWEQCRARGDFAPLAADLFAREGELYRQSAIGLVLERIDARASLGGGCEIWIESELPAGAGMGSSAAAAVALAYAVPRALGVELPLAEVNALAYEMENWAHGHSSGGDNAVACHGGALWFENGDPRPLTVPDEVMREIVVGLAGRPEKSTSALVQQVRELPASGRDARMRALGECAAEMRRAFAGAPTDSAKPVRSAMARAQAELRALGVSARKIDEVARALEARGGAAKLSGAGAGGAVLCMHPSREVSAAALEGAGCAVLPVSLGVPGVRIVD